MSRQRQGTYLCRQHVMYCSITNFRVDPVLREQTQFFGIKDSGSRDDDPYETTGPSGRADVNSLGKYVMMLEKISRRRATTTAPAQHSIYEESCSCCTLYSGGGCFLPPFRNLPQGLHLTTIFQDDALSFFWVHAFGLSPLWLNIVSHLLIHYNEIHRSKSICAPIRLCSSLSRTLANAKVFFMCTPVDHVHYYRLYM